MNTSTLLLAVASLLLALVASAAAHAAYSDPSGRVARLSDSSGEVSYSPAGEDQWYAISRNRPLSRGDRLWTDRNGRAELQFGSAALRLGAETSFEILDLDDRIAQLQVTQGTIGVSVRRLYRGQTIEVATPTLAFVIDRAGRYRIDVDPDGVRTTIVVWEGSGEAWGEGSNFSLQAGDAVSFYSSDLRDHEMYALPQGDRFDSYCMTRDRRLSQSASLRYVDDDLIGYADLDEYGSWGNTRDYGNVWYPTQVAANWAPYRDGHWVWQEPWGWTWVDDSPWGFAPSHYGRWVSVSGRWGWLPGPRNVRPVYAPALVAFVGGSDWGLSISVGGGSRSGGSRIGWFPLGPRDVYMPSYRASREYFTQVNVSNTVVNNTTINNVYNNYSSGNINVAQANYANRGMADAFTAVPGDVFRNSQPVNRAAIELDQQALAQAEIMNLAPLAPSAQSIAGSAPSARVKPSPGAFDRNVYARNAPPPEQLPFAARQELLQRNPGMAVEPVAKPQGNANRRARKHVRVIAAGAAATDARAAGRDGEKPAVGKPAQLPPLDRSAGSDRPKEPSGRYREDERGDTRPTAVVPEPPAPADSVKEPPVTKPRGDAGGAQQQAQRQAEQQAQRQAAEQQRQMDAQQQAQQQQRENAEAQQQQRENAETQRQAEQQARQQRQDQQQRQQRQDAEAQQAQRQAEQQAQQQQQQQALQQRQEQQQQQRENAEAQQAQRQAEQQAQQQQRQDQQQQQKPAEAPQPPPDPGHGQGKPPRENPNKPAADEDEEELDADGNPKPKKKRDHRP